MLISAYCALIINELRWLIIVDIIEDGPVKNCLEKYLQDCPDVCITFETGKERTSFQ